jgi:hypothetical protein
MNLHTMAQRIEHWLIEKLIPYARNPRTHSDAQITQIAASIAEFGFNNPILVDTKAGMIAGHGRLLAARKLQLKEVPVIVLEHLTETQKRAYILRQPPGAECRLGRGRASRRTRCPPGGRFSLESIGFEDEELARLLAAQDASDGLTDEDAVPGFQPPQIELCPVDPKGETLYIMRLGQPKNQYFAPDGKPITKEEADRLTWALETADLA